MHVVADRVGQQMAAQHGGPDRLTDLVRLEVAAQIALCDRRPNLFGR
jgi:hypothetical protein